MNDAREQIYHKTLEAAGKQLSYRALSQGALEKKLLEKGYPEEAVAYAIAWLEERQMLNDTAYAASMAQAYARRGYGVRRIRQELMHRQISREITDEVLQEIEANQEQMRKLLDKRLHGDLSDRREVQKAIAALQRRGFLWDDIKRVLDLYRAESIATDDLDED